MSDEVTLKRWQVTVKMAGTYSAEVDAEDEEHACEIATQSFGLDCLEIEYAEAFQIAGVGRDDPEEADE
jgi:hypothetical protein